MADRVRAMTVEGLFGRYDYALDLTIGAGRVGHHENLSLLYGRNGTGKSTILRLLYHALSPSITEGHRTALAHMPFDTTTIDFQDGDSVSYTRYETRKGRRTRLKMSVRIGESELSDIFELNSRGQIGVEQVDVRTGTAAELLTRLDVDPFILTDSRQIFSDLIDEDDDEEGPRTVRAPKDRLTSGARSVDLGKALREVERHFNFQIYRGSREGLVQVDRTYADIVGQIVQSAQGAGRPKKSTVPDLIDRVARLEAQSDLFVRHGLLPEVFYGGILTHLNQAADRTGPTLQSVLTPYLDGIEQRMISLSVIAETIDSFVSLSNDFLEDKSLLYDSETTSVRIIDDIRGEEIDPNSLSSGEKQLLVLFGYLTSARGGTKLFIIDEPELSLNPSWIRKLVPALMRLMHGAEMQLVCATHSIEILAPYDADVIDLDETRV